MTQPGIVADAATSLTASQTVASADGEKTSLLVVDDEALGLKKYRL